MIDLSSSRSLKQQSDVNKWIQHGAKGYFEWCTGSGKSYLACLAIKLCNSRHPNKQINVVVPTTVLEEAWTDEKKGHIKIHGLKNVNVFVINTYVKETHDCALLIIDEVHTAAGSKSKHFNTVIDKTNFNWIMCLSATLEKEHKEFLHKRNINCISKLTADEAVKNGWLSPYKVLCVPVNLNEEDLSKYKTLNDNYNRYGSPFYKGALIDFEIAMGCLNRGTILTNYSKEIGWDEKKLQIMALQWNKSMRLRKEFLYHVEAKIDAAIEITKTLGMQTILFGQSIKGADKINDALKDKCVEYHSKLTAKQLKDNLKRLRDGRTKVDYISSAKGLEAGFDLPNLQLGITWSRTSKALRATQTLGRILRKVEGKTAYFIELYVPDTQDERWLKNSLKGQSNVYYLKSVDQIYQIINHDRGIKTV
jgi:superfamily II DNA or RNA helicase